MQLRPLVYVLLLSLLSACSGKKEKTQAKPTSPGNVQATAIDAGMEVALPLVDLPSSPDSALPLDSKITSGTLENGLTYYILPNTLPEKRAEFWMSINAGSFQEDEDQRGLAHFLEHMAFNGTKSFPKNELIAKLESLGVDFGAHLNAATSFDETVYKLRLPTDQESSVDLGLQILAEWISGITLDADEFEKERGVILAEKRSGDGPQARLMESLIADALEGTRYAKRLPIGVPEVLKKAPLAAIQRFYKDWYYPGNAAIYVVGDIDAKQIEDKIKVQFGSIPANPSPRQAPARTMPKGGALKFLNLQDKELPMTAVGVGRFVPARPLKTVGDFRKEYIDIMASTLLSQRMEAAKTKDKVSFLMGGAAVAQVVRSLRLQVVLAVLDPAKVSEGTTDLLHEVERAGRHGFITSEMERAAKELTSQIRSQAKDARDGKETSSALVEELTRYHLQDQAMPGRMMEYALFDHFGKTLTLEEVNAVFADFFEADGLVAASMGAIKSSELSEGAFKKMLADLATAKLPAYAEEASGTELLKNEPKAGTITEKSHDKKLDVYTWKLSNGATVHLKKTDFKSDEVLFRAFSVGGMQDVADADLAALASAADLVVAGGLGDFDSTALERALAGHDVSLAPFIDMHSEGLRGSAGTDDLETLFKLAHLYFESPRKDDVAAGVLKDTLIASLKQQDKDPDFRFRAELLPLMSNKDPRGQFMDYKAAGKLDLERSMALYQDRMKNAGDFHFYIVGAFDLAAIEPLVVTYLASLPGGDRVETRDERVWPHNPKRSTLTVRQGTQDRASISLFYNQRRETGTPSLTERLALEAFARAARMQVLKIFREELGESYGAGVKTDWGLNGTILLVQLQSSPAAANSVAKRAEEEIAKLVGGAIKPEFFENAKSAMLKADEDYLRTNGHWIRALQSVQELATAPSDILDRKTAIAALTIEDVKKTIAERVDAERPVVGILLPKK